MDIGIEALGDCFLKVFQEFLSISSIDNVILDHFRFLHILDTNIILTETGSRNRLFVTVFSMNDRRQSLTLVHVDGIPDLADPGAGRIDDFNILW